MNPVTLKATRDLIAQHDDLFDQRVYAKKSAFHDEVSCSTPACVAGFAIVAAGNSAILNAFVRCEASPRTVWDEAKRVLGLDEHQAVYMFDCRPFAHRRATHTDAILMLDRAIRLDYVNWVSRIDCHGYED